LPSDSGGASRHLVTYADGERIFSQGDRGDEMYIVQDGEVEIVLTADDGTVVSLVTLERGDFFGEMAVLEGAPRTASARAHTECRVLPVSGATFAKILRNNPEISIRLMRKLCARLRGAEERLRRRRVSRGMAEDRPAADPGPSTTAGRFRERESGVEMVLPLKPELTVGRPDRASGTGPDIDLSAVNKDRSVSRRHARILRREGRLFVYEEPGTANGTWLNGERVAPATPVEFSAGDELRFGSVRLVYGED
jgi:CRP-like cAMP-binding protein